jgi:hypothetical protein
MKCKIIKYKKQAQDAHSNLGVLDGSLRRNHSAPAREINPKRRTDQSANGEQREHDIHGATIFWIPTLNEKRVLFFIRFDEQTHLSHH